MSEPLDYPLVSYDAVEGCNTHMEGAEKVLHGVPEGYAFDAGGELHPEEEPPARRKSKAEKAPTVAEET